jgi:hypothetical protein
MLFILLLRTTVTSVLAFSTVWPQCGSQDFMLMTNYYSGFQQYKPPANLAATSLFQSNFTFNCTTTLPTTACFVPMAGASVNPFAAVMMPFDSPTPLASNSVITIGYSIQYVEGFDIVNTFGYGFDSLVFFGSSDSMIAPSGPAFGLSTGSPMSNFAYPEFDVVVPMASVFPLRGATNHLCDVLNLYNESSAMPCAFFEQTSFGQPLRTPRFDVTLKFNFTGSTLWLMSALVKYSPSNSVLVNLTNLAESWSSTPATPDKTHYFGVISQRSPLQLTGIYLTVRPPVPCATTSTTTIATITTSKMTRITPAGPITSPSTEPPSTTSTPSQQQQTTINGASQTSIDATTTTTHFTSSTSPNSAPLSTNGVTTITTTTINSNQTDPSVLSLPLGTTPTENSVGGETELFITLFAVFAAICCCFIICTVLRKRVRRSARFRRLYFSAPRPVRVVFCFACRKADEEYQQDYQEGKIKSTLLLLLYLCVFKLTRSARTRDARRC